MWFLDTIINTYTSLVNYIIFSKKSVVTGLKNTKEYLMITVLSIKSFYKYINIKWENFCKNIQRVLQGILLLIVFFIFLSYKLGDNINFFINDKIKKLKKKLGIDHK